SADRFRWVILALLFASTALNYIDRQTLSVLLPELERKIALTPAEYGTITSLFLVAYMVAQPVAGALIDAIGTRAGFAVMVLFWSAASILQGLVRGALGFGILRVLLGLGEAGNWPAGCRAVALWFPKERRALAMGIFDGGSAAGAIVAVPLTAFAAIYFGWRLTFVAIGSLGFVWLALWLVFYRDPIAEAASPSPVAETPPRALDLVRGRSFWSIFFARMFTTPVWWFYVFWLPEYLGRFRGLSLAKIGLYAWLPFLTVDVGKVLGGLASDRLISAGRAPIPTRKVVMAVGALTMVAGIKVVGAASLAAAIGWVCVATFGFGLWSSNILALMADVYPAKVLGRAVGMTGSGASLGGALFTFAVGIIVSRTSYGPVFWIAGLAPLAAFAAASTVAP
ncbi:MAG TPA: MFS transporter, partial [Opitutaceae bacterium]|nr:MFS transporter [Opitutaceae bacterium]